MAKRDDASNVTAILNDVQGALRAVRAEQNGTSVEAEASVKLDPDAISAALAQVIDLVQMASKRIEMTNDLKQLALAAVNFSDANAKMLPSAVYDKSGKPLLSWRVLVLPYIEQGELYKQFHLDEPWDSENNKKLIDRMPTQFAPQDSEAAKQHETFFQGFVGKGSVLEEGAVLRYPGSIPDGTSDTILFVEAAKSVPWTKPEDIPFDEGKLLAKVGGLKLGGAKAGFLAAMCDGYVRFLPLTLKEETLRALVTRNGGEVIPDLDK